MQQTACQCRGAIAAFVINRLRRPARSAQCPRTVRGQSRTPSPASRGPQRVPAKRGRRWHIAARRGRIKALPEGAHKTATQHVEYLKAAVRARLEHPFRVLKRQFGYSKVRFKGLAVDADAKVTHMPVHS